MCVETARAAEPLNWRSIWKRCASARAPGRWRPGDRSRPNLRNADPSAGRQGCLSRSP